jgi:hypothetical protein
MVRSIERNDLEHADLEGISFKIRHGFDGDSTSMPCSSGVSWVM